MRRAIKITGIAFGILGGLSMMLFLVARVYVNDGDVPVVESLLPPDTERRHLMAIFPHPDEPRFPVQRLYMTTLSSGMLDAALRLSATFRERYPRAPDRQLPAPDVAVRITAHGAAKYAAIDAHRTQWESLRSVMPFHHVLPHWLYFRWLDREYFALAEQR